MRARWINFLGLLAATAVALDGCNGTGDSGGGGGGVTDASATGVWSGSDSDNVTGTVTSISTAGTGSYAVVNGVQFTGLASRDSSHSPAELTLAVTGASSSAKYAIVSVLTGS